LRRIRHLTQAELARRIGIRTGPMNSIEHGKHVPSGRVLYRLAETLQVSVDTILGRSAARPGTGASAEPDCAPAVVRESEERARYVTAADLGDWPRAQLVALPDDLPLDEVSRLRVDRVCRAFLALEDLCGAQKRAHIPLYLPFVATEPGIEELTARVRQMLGVNHAVIFDYLELLENAGLRVVFCPLDDGVQSAAFYDPVNCNAFLIVRDGMNVERQLFELLKRLGAIYVHTQQAFCPPPLGLMQGKSEAASLAPVLDALHAARKFAALFLMPAQAVRASIAQLGIGPDQWTYELLLRLKHRFGVSAQSFTMRLKELRLIAPRAAEEIERRIEAHYARTNYGEPDSSRRILSPNGRLGDLLLAALDKPETRGEARTIEKVLREIGVGWRGAPVQKVGR
jgi:transcriptional regulator with XRE-family HTH domain/Zn-dependent peptidase ImmA (M78 family)